MRVIHLARKPLSGGSVASNVLEHGAGALHIDASRLGTTESLDGGAYAKNAADRHDGAENWRYKRGEVGEFRQPSGRWPANIILHHLDGCQRTGTTKIKAKQLTAGRRTIKWGVGEGGDTYEKGEGARFATEDGLVDAPVWYCVSGCPVADLDEQSGDRPVSGAAKSGRPAVGGGSTGVLQFGVEAGNGTLHNDSGGASRFFKTLP